MIKDELPKGNMTKTADVIHVMFCLKSRCTQLINSHWEGKLVLKCGAGL